jgi:hypothetical protein
MRGVTCIVCAAFLCCAFPVHGNSMRMLLRRLDCQIDTRLEMSCRDHRGWDFLLDPAEFSKKPNPHFTKALLGKISRGSAPHKKLTFEQRRIGFRIIITTDFAFLEALDLCMHDPSTNGLQIGESMLAVAGEIDDQYQWWKTLPSAVTGKQSQEKFDEELEHDLWSEALSVKFTNADARERCALFNLWSDNFYHLFEVLPEVSRGEFWQMSDMLIDETFIKVRILLYKAVSLLKLGRSLFLRRCQVYKFGQRRPGAPSVLDGPDNDEDNVLGDIFS